MIAADLANNSSYPEYLDRMTQVVLAGEPYGTADTQGSSCVMPIRTVDDALPGPTLRPGPSQWAS